METTHIDTGRQDRVGVAFCGAKTDSIMDSFSFAQADFYLRKAPQNLTADTTCEGCRKGFFFAKS